MSCCCYFSLLVVELYYGTTGETTVELLTSNSKGIVGLSRSAERSLNRSTSTRREMLRGWTQEVGRNNGLDLFVLNVIPHHFHPLELPQPKTTSTSSSQQYPVRSPLSGMQQCFY